MSQPYPVRQLGDLCDVLDSKRRPITKRDRVDGEYPYYGATGILGYVEGFIFDEPLVLIGEDGAKWGAGENTAFSAEGRYWVNNHAHVIRPHRQKLLDSWLIYQLNQVDLSPFITGLTVPKLNQAKMREIPIIVPPLDEQRRIVAVLDKAFAGIATATATAQKNLANAKELFESYQSTLFLEAGESVILLGEMADFRNGLNFTGSSQGEIIRIVGVKDFQDRLWIPDENLAQAQIDGKLADSDILQEGDILTVRSNGNRELIGRCMVAPKMSAKTSHSGFTIRIRPDSDKVDPNYLCRILKSPQARKRLVDGGNGANISSLNQQLLGSLPVPVPDKSRQLEIVRKIDRMMAHSVRLRASMDAKLAALSELKQALLQKAFAGELT